MRVKAPHLLLIVLTLLIFNNLVNSALQTRYLSKLLCNLFPFQALSSNVPNPKIVLMGSSTTMGGPSVKIIEDLLGLSEGEVIVLATMPNNPEINYNILSRYIGKLNGAVIVYGVDPWILSEYYYQHFNYKLSKWDMIERYQYIKAKKPNFARIIDVINGGNLFANLKALYVNKKDLDIEIYHDKTWDDMDPQAKLPFVEMTHYPEFPISQDFLDSIQQMEKLCDTGNCKLYLYMPAYSETFISEYRKSAYCDALNRKIGSISIFKYLDFSLKSMPDSLFCDGIHVNAKGKVILSENMGSSLMSTFRATLSRCNK